MQTRAFASLFVRLMLHMPTGALPMSSLANKSVIFQFFHNTICLLTSQISKVPDIGVPERTIFEQRKDTDQGINQRPERIINLLPRKSHPYRLTNLIESWRFFPLFQQCTKDPGDSEILPIHKPGCQQNCFNQVAVSQP